MQVFFTVADAREKLDHRRQDYNRVRPHGTRGDSAPEEFANAWRRARHRFDSPRVSGSIVIFNERHQRCVLSWYAEY